MHNNILVNKLPQYVEIGGAEVKINTDFRISIQFENLLKDTKLNDEEIFNKALSLYYPVLPPEEDINEAVQKMLWFYRCGKEYKEEKKAKKAQKEIYSFEYDADKIYSAFLDQYRVDLQECELHWWKFKAMFNSLKEDNEISKIMSIRAMDTSKLSKEQKEHYNKLKKIYAIPRSEEEIKHNKNLAEILKRGGDLSELKEQ